MTEDDLALGELMDNLEGEDLDTPIYIRIEVPGTGATEIRTLSRNVEFFDDVHGVRACYLALND